MCELHELHELANERNIFLIKYLLYKRIAIMFFIHIIPPS